MDDRDLLACVAGMADQQHRAGAARSLASLFGADDLMIFVADPAVGQSLPAPGFPQTLPDARRWRDLIARAIASGSATGTVTNAAGEEAQARVVAIADGTALALIGVRDTDRESVLTTLLPLFSSLLSAESAARLASAEAILARQSAVQASELAARLDTTRADLHRALAVAETATRARDEFLATISHELRTPLTSIIGWVQLLRGETDPSIIADGLDTIDRNARAQSRLIEDVLEFSRINAGKLRLDVKSLELTDVIKAAIDVVRPAADAKGVRVDSVLDPNAGRISGDPDRLQQVIWNLLSNAVKFTPRGGRVQVRLERINSHAEFSVADTGEGISAEFLPFVFERFSQADSSSTRVHAGLGLGLGIVRHLVELHGGTVHAFSPGLGKGSTFLVRLPLLVAHHQPADLRPPTFAMPLREAPREEPADLTGIDVLVIEDNDDARRLLATILGRSGAKVRAAESVSAGLHLFAASRPDIIVSDIEMPREDGYSLIRKVRLLEASGRRVPAIALTAYARSVDRVRALAAGFQMHIAKPVEPVELVAAIRSLVSTQSGQSAQMIR